MLIIKQSASYSSTASAISTPGASSGYGGTSAPSASEGAGSLDLRTTRSPPMVTVDGIASSGLKVGMTTQAQSPGIKHLAAMHPRAGGSDYQAGLPALPSPATHQPTMPQWSQPQHLQGSNLALQGVRNSSWDFSGYVNASPTSATPGVPQNLQYARGNLVTDSRLNREDDMAGHQKSHQVSES
jgi:hypothetical protein